MKTKVLVGVLLFLIVVNLASIGTYLYQRYTSPPDGGMGFQPGGMGGPMFGRGESPMMQLSAEQRQRMMELFQAFHEETGEIHQMIRSLEDQTFELMQHESVPMEAVDGNLRQLAALRLEMSRRATQNLIKAKSFLTPEQQRMFYGAITQARPGPGPGGPMGGGPFGGRRGPGFRGPDSLR
ncbi:MAG: periplasmic heavy metal sensor [Bacteroidota bacterium]